jgi:hypothetical protein
VPEVEYACQSDIIIGINVFDTTSVTVVCFCAIQSTVDLAYNCVSHRMHAALHPKTNLNTKVCVKWYVFLRQRDYFQFATSSLFPIHDIIKIN